MNDILEQMMQKYNIKDKKGEINAIKEIIQEIVLCGLSRSDFFNEVAFYGGTALRIFYGLNRFSENLDFALLTPNKDFDLTKYFPYIESEANSYGLNLTISKKEKRNESNILSAFLKGDTKELILTFFPNGSLQSNNALLKNIKIKFEIDISPASEANYECKYKLLPSAHQVRIYDESSLFAGKIHAILCRSWKTRTKGRDLYDYVFFLSKNIKVNMELVKNKLIDSNYIAKDEILSIDKLKDMLNEKFKEIDYENAKEDVLSFIDKNDALDLWNAEFFSEITEYLEAN